MSAPRGSRVPMRAPVPSAMVFDDLRGELGFSEKTGGALLLDYGAELGQAPCPRSDLGIDRERARCLDVKAFLEGVIGVVEDKEGLAAGRFGAGIDFGLQRIETGARAWPLAL